jgi:hypothetical protein
MTRDQARKFFGALYAGPGGTDLVDQGTFDEIATRFIVKTDGAQTAVGTTALQSLLLAYTFRHEKSGKPPSAAHELMMAHINRVWVGAVLQSNPNLTVDELVNSAEESGFDVDILGT